MWLGSAAVCSGALWQPLVNALKPREAPVQRRHGRDDGGVRRRLLTGLRVGRFVFPGCPVVTTATTHGRDARGKSNCRGASPPLLNMASTPSTRRDGVAVCSLTLSMDSLVDLRTGGAWLLRRHGRRLPGRRRQLPATDSGSRTSTPTSSASSSRHRRRASASAPSVGPERDLRAGLGLDRPSM